MWQSILVAGCWLLIGLYFILLGTCCLRFCFPPPRSRDIETGEPSNNNIVVPDQAGEPLPEQQPASSMPISTGTIIAYKINEEKESNYKECAICLEEFKDGDVCRVLSKCNHLFCQLCIDSWLAKAMHCPLCRGSVHNSEPTILIRSDSSEYWSAPTTPIQSNYSESLGP